MYLVGHVFLGIFKFTAVLDQLRINARTEFESIHGKIDGNNSNDENGNGPNNLKKSTNTTKEEEQNDENERREKTYNIKDSEKDSNYESDKEYSRMNTAEMVLKPLTDAIRDRKQRYDLEHGINPPLPNYDDNTNKVLSNKLYPNIPPKTKNINDECTYDTIDSIYSPKPPTPTAPQLPIRMHRLKRDKLNTETSQENKTNIV